MPYLLDLADACRKSGLPVVEVPGWSTRGHGPMQSVSGIVCHHTATSARATGSYPSLAIVRDGRSDLAGPLSQLGLGRDGVVYIIAAGKCWHAGPVNDMRYSNSNAIGIEAEHDGLGPWWDPAMYDAYVRLVAALQSHYGIAAPPRGHKEVAIPLGVKVDPTFDMDRFRADVARGTTQEELMVTTDDEKKIRAIVREVVREEVRAGIKALLATKVPLSAGVKAINGSRLTEISVAGALGYSTLMLPVARIIRAAERRKKASRK